MLENGAEGAGGAVDAAARCCKALSWDRSKLGWEGGGGTGAAAALLLLKPCKTPDSVSKIEFAPAGGSTGFDDGPASAG